MSWERERRIQVLLAEVAELRRQEEAERSMVKKGWVPMGDGAYRVPGSIQMYRVKR